MRGLIKWFIENSIAANLLMFFLILLGVMQLFTMKQELFPHIEPNFISVSVTFPGETPDGVEKGICIKIEEALDGLDGIKKLSSTAAEGIGTVLVEHEYDADRAKLVRQITSRVDSISTFPEDAEKPVVTDADFKAPVLSLAITADVDDLSIRRLTENIRDELTSLREVSRVDLIDGKRFEVAIEVSEEALKRYGLTFDHVAAAVRGWSLNLPAGTVRTQGGEILLRTSREAYQAHEFEQITLRSRRDGTQILLSDVATIRDGFEENDEGVSFDNRPAAWLSVFRVGSQSAPDVKRAVMEKVEELRKTLPHGVRIDPWKDQEEMLADRKTLLLKNGAMGLVLVFLVLALFLKFGLALWVSAGLVTAVLGTFVLMPQADQSINMMSLFAFIVVLGILVDDAIVVSENVYHHHHFLKKPGKKAAIEGTWEVMVPVVLAVLTTIAAFLPMATLPGTMGQFARVIPIVVMLALTMSLVESLFILPAHLTHLDSWTNRIPGIVQVQSGVARALAWFVDRHYRPMLRLAVRFRYATIAIGVMVLLVCLGVLKGGYVKWEFFPIIEGNNVVVTLDMPEGTAREETEAQLAFIKQMGEDVVAEYSQRAGQNLHLHTMVVMGYQPQKIENDWQTRGAGGFRTSPNLGEVNIELIPAERREGFNAIDIMNEWRSRTGTIPGAEELVFKADVSGSAEDINVELRASDREALEAATEEVMAWLAGIEGIIDIRKNLRLGKRELKMELTDEGKALALTAFEVNRQVNQAFFGEEAQRLQRGRDDLKVMVRYPEADRRSIADLEGLHIRLPDGSEVPFATVASVAEDRGPSVIHRSRRLPAINILGDFDPALDIDSRTFKAAINGFMPRLLAKYPGLQFSLEGDQAQQEETMGGMARGAVITMFIIFALLALAFRSWIQPVVVMIAIPFGLVGSVLGHLVFGYQLSLLSVIGIMAMSGVVVNDSMIMIDFANRAMRDGTKPLDAIMEAGPRRFRAIIITSLTTFAGLAPMLMEKSVQAQFLIPMAISLAFGVVFSTAIILVMVPAVFVMIIDIQRGFGWWGRGLKAPFLAVAVADPQEGVVIRHDNSPIDESAASDARSSVYETLLGSHHPPPPPLSAPKPPSSQLSSDKPEDSSP